MEFSELGKLCAECGVLDYCPFLCNKCTKTFCIKHYNYANHACVSTGSDKLFINCPKCKKTLSLKRCDAETALKVHSDECIKLHPEKYCAKKNCKHRHLIICRVCNKKYCVAHRINHKCSTVKK